MFSNDPFSTACVEPRAQTVEEKAGKSEGNTKLFFSRVGKRRLRRIWEDHKLDEEIFLSFHETAAPMRENVSDYVQRYLIQRMRRLSFQKQHTQQQQQLQLQRPSDSKDSTPSTKRIFQTYEDFVANLHKGRDRERISAEIERVTTLLIEGRGVSAPEGFELVLRNPIFLMNRLLESVKLLEKKRIRVKGLPFEIRKRRIRNAGVESESSHFLLGDARGDDVEESWEFDSQELSTAKRRTKYEYDYELLQSPSERRERNFSPSPSLSIFSEDEELSFAEKDLGETQTSSLPLSNEIEKYVDLRTPDFEDQGCDVMYQMGKEIVELYQRQGVAGNEFMEHFTVPM